MSSVSQYFKGLFGGIGALLTGMSVTWKELFKKKITQQYPENRKTLVISDRFRGELIMPHDENNEHACTSCGICEMNCPNGTIKIKSKTIENEDGKKKKILESYYYNLGMCTFCNLCVITCPSNAIRFENVFENAIFTKEKLNMKLNQEGSKLREKKKPEPKPVGEKPATPTAEKKKPTDAVSKPEATDKPGEEKAGVSRNNNSSETESSISKPATIRDRSENKPADSDSLNKDRSAGDKDKKRYI